MNDKGDITISNTITLPGKDHIAAPIGDIQIDDEPFLQMCMDYLNKVYGVGFNQVLINWYPDNQSYIGDHSDDESMFTNNTVLCFNYCKIPRDIVLKRKKKDKKSGMELPKMKPIKHAMEHNTGYIMEGTDFQNMYTHGIPKRVSRASVGVDERRVSFTFRVFK